MKITHHVSNQEIFLIAQASGAQMGSVNSHIQLPVKTVKSPVVTLYSSESIWQLIGLVGGVMSCPAHVVEAGTPLAGVPPLVVVGVAFATVPICKVWLDVVRGI